MIRVTLPSLIVVDKPTPNENIYSLDVLTEIIREANSRLVNESVPCYKSLDRRDLVVVIGYVKRLALVESELLIEVEFIDTAEARPFVELLAAKCSISLNTMIEVELPSDIEKLSNGTSLIKNGKLVAVAPYLVPIEVDS